MGKWIAARLSSSLFPTTVGKSCPFAPRDAPWRSKSSKLNHIFSNNDIGRTDKILDTITELVKEAGDLIKNYFRRLRSCDIEKKGFSHYVTRADKEAEDLLVTELQKEFPDIGICAEESKEVKGRGRFLIDPLDGTHNFMHGIPHFCVSIAYELESRIETSIIYDPIKDELFQATRGNGAFLNGYPIKPSKLFVISFFYNRLTRIAKTP